MKQVTTALLLLTFLGSCISNNKLTYLSNGNFNAAQAISIQNTPDIYRLQPGDVLNVRIKTLDEESSNYYNMLPEQGVLNYNNMGLYLNSYSITKDGTIELPGAGSIAVATLTVEEAQKKIKTAMHEYLNNATVIVKLVSFKITVLGEVTRPGYYFVYNDQATLLEALGLAGDLTDFGDRKNITLIRQTPKGSESILLNLKDARLLQSPYYFLKPNDVVYIPPMRAKSARGNLGTLGILFAGITATVLVLEYTNPQ